MYIYIHVYIMCVCYIISNVHSLHMQTIRNSLLIEDHMTGIESGSCSVSKNGQRSSKVFGQDCIGWVAADAARGLQLVCRYVWVNALH